MDYTELSNTLSDMISKIDVDDALIVTRSVEAWMRRFTDNRITVSKNWRLGDGAFYIIKGKRSIGFEISNIDVKSISEAVNYSLKLINKAPESDSKPNLPKGPSDYGDRYLAYDPKVTDLGDSSVDIIGEALNSASKEGAKKSSGTLTFGSRSRSIFTTTGCEGVERSTFVEFSIRSFYDEESTGQSVWCGSGLRGFNPSELGREAGRTAYEARKLRPGKSGLYDVIFKPYAIANLINTVAESSSAYLADIGLSYLKDKLGKKVASEVFSLIDDPRNPASPETSLFDDEGRRTVPIQIIVDGYLRSFLHTSKTARSHRVEPTGNSYFSASIGDMIPSPRSLTVNQGDFEEDELIEELENGIIISNVWYTRFNNYLTGDFSTIPRDGLFEVKNGEITGALKGLRVSENMLRILSNIKGMGKKRSWVQWWEVDVPVLVSSFLTDKVHLTKSTK